MNADELLGPYSTVFDVGAFRGDFAMLALDAWDARVLSFEPLEPKPRNLSDKGGRWTWHPVALGARPGIATIHRNVFVPSSSMLLMLPLHEQAFPYTKGSTPVEVQVVTLDDYADEIVGRTLLKIDVQGYEIEVLRGGEDVVERSEAVLLEVSHEPLYAGAPTPGEIAVFLRERGFSLASVVEQLFHPKQPNLLLQSDQLWIR